MEDTGKICLEILQGRRLQDDPDIDSSGRGLVASFKNMVMGVLSIMGEKFADLSLAVKTDSATMSQVTLFGQILRYNKAHPFRAELECFWESGAPLLQQNRTIWERFKTASH